MVAAVGRGEFLEHAEVHGALYGTRRAAAEAILKAGRVAVLDIDVQGARQVRRGRGGLMYYSRCCCGGWLCVGWGRVLSAQTRTHTAPTRPRAPQLRASGLPALFVFVAPPSLEELERRLRSRRGDGEAQMRRRLGAAKGEITSLNEKGLYGGFAADGCGCGRGVAVTIQC